MKEDKFEQVVKESLESMNPDVPAHLWDNIRANIPSTPPAEAVSGAGQGAAGGIGAGASGLLKLGAAAVVLIGGGILVWQLNTGEVNNAANDANEIAEQSEPVAPILMENEASGQPVSDGIDDQVVESEVSTDVNRGDHPMQESTANIAQEQDTEGESPILNEPKETGSAQKPSEKADVSKESQTTHAQNTVSERADANVIPGDQNEHDSTPKVQEQSAVNTHSNAAPNPVPLQVVEVGILADEVYGEAPLSIQFSNVTNAKRYEWDFGNGRKSNEASPMPTFDRPGEYVVKLTVTDFEGNRLSDEMEISVIEPSVIYLPNVFTPNGDGLNDFFEAKGSNISEVSIEIFRLDGSQVFKGTDLNDRWDGNDRQQPDNRQYMVVTQYVKNDGTPVMEKSMLTVIRE